MENVIYKKVIVNARSSMDGESPTIIYVTQEANGVAVFLQECDNEDKLLKWFHTYHKNEAIEYGVNEAENMMIAQADKRRLATA